MKKTIFLTVAVSLLIWTVSCNKPSASATSGNQPFPSTEYSVQQSASLELKTIAVDEWLRPPRATSDVGLHYIIRFTYPSQSKNKAVLESLQRKFITHVFGKDYASLTPEAAVNACIEDWKKEYNKDMKEMAKENSSEYVLIYEYVCTDTLLFMNDALLQMQTYSYIQQGGAHGFGGSSSHLFNLQTGKEYSRDDIFKPEKADFIVWSISDALFNYLGIEDGEDNPISFKDLWSEEINFAVTQKGIVLTYDNQWIQDAIILPYTRIMANLHEDTPVWELAKDAAMGELNDNSRALLDKDGLSIGSSLEDLLKRYPKCKIEIYYTDTGSYQYATLEEMLNGYGKDWYGVYCDWAIFTPLKSNGEEMGIRFFILFKDLDNRSKYQKESKIWMIND